MLLRRVMEHVQAQNWTAVWLDFLIVVVGVFVGLQVSNWNDARIDQATERQVLIALREDIATSTSHIHDLAKRVKTANEHLEIVVRYADGEFEGLELETLDRHMLRGVFALHQFNPSLITYDELKNSGRLGLIGDANLRKQLQRVATQIAVVEDRESNISQSVFDLIDPYLVKNYDVRGFIAIQTAEGEPGVDWLDPLKNRRDAKVALRNPDFLNIALYRARMNNNYRNSLLELDSTFVEIDQLVATRLQKLGHAP